MDFSLTEPERDLVGLCRDFAQKEIATRAPLAWDEARCPTDLLREMGGLGLLGMLIPEEWGGIGMSTVGFVAAMEQIGLADQSVAAAWQAHVTIGSLPLYLFGNDAQRERWLRPLAEGRGARRVRADRARRRFRRARDPHRAERRDGGWLINGRKTFISNAGTDMSFGVTLLARTESAEGERRSSRASSSRRTPPGFTMGPKMRGIGWRGLDTRELYFDDVWVPDDHLVGDPDLGLSQFLRTLEVGRISIAALSLSLTQAVLDLATDYARQRVQFGQPISKFQAIQFKLADIATELEAARWLTYRAAYLRDTGQPFLKEASMAKLKASRLAVSAASEAVQIHGGLGYMLESPVARFYCDAKVLEIGEGTNEIQHLVIARAAGLLSDSAATRVARRRMASAMSSRSGSQARSSSGAYGGGVAAAPMRSIGASRSQKPSRATVAAISAPMPNGTTASWAIRSRLVLCTESRIGTMSSGATVRRSITSTEMPSPASCSAAATASCTIRETDTTVTSVPARTTADRADRHDVVGGRLRALHAVEQTVLDEHDRVRILDRGAQQPVGVGRRRRHHDAQPGDVREQRLEALRVLASRRAPGAELRAHGQRHLARRRRS